MRIDLRRVTLTLRLHPELHWHLSLASWRMAFADPSGTTITFWL
jgi:hypothetical protein